MISSRFWNPLAELSCLNCETRFPIDALHFDGCPTCARRAPLVIAYREIDLPERDLGAQIAAISKTRMPICSESVLGLGQGNTPLVPLPRAEDPLFAKIEGQNPTGSHKDRFHAISEAIAAALGFPAVVAASTGNHGLAATASPGPAGLDALVLLDPDAPRALAIQLSIHGARVATIPGAVQSTIIRLVDESGWFPSTSADPTLAGRGNPYGAEGYKAIAYEIVNDLGRAPDVVAVPAASGDTYYGVWRGFADLHELLDLPMPMLLACQPEGAAPLALAESSDGEALEVSDPTSLALSARDPRSGWHARFALRKGGQVVTVEEDLLLETIVDLGRRGFGVEPASALSVAAIALARDSGLVAPASTAVAVLTSSNANWTEHLTALGPKTLVDDPTAIFATLR